MSDTNSVKLKFENILLSKYVHILFLLIDINQHELTEHVFLILSCPESATSDVLNTFQSQKKVYFFVS